ncbi:MAG: hypothetical protein HY975_00050 [Candidatus Kerfeldbacteria bacterium]|nr:hypothetical protein [Candidatus Kerfeldbacteria bacterium]
MPTPMPKPAPVQPTPAAAPVQPKKAKSNYLIPVIVALLAVGAFLFVINLAIK